MYIHLCMHINIFKVFKVAYYIHTKKRFNQSQMQIDVFNVFNRYIIIHCVRPSTPITHFLLSPSHVCNCCKSYRKRQKWYRQSQWPTTSPPMYLYNQPLPCLCYSVAFIRKVVRGPGVGLGVEVVSPRYRINSIYLDIEWSYLEFDCTGLRWNDLIYSITIYIKLILHRINSINLDSEWTKSIEFDIISSL